MANPRIFDLQEDWYQLYEYFSCTTNMRSHDPKSLLNDQTRLTLTPPQLEILNSILTLIDAPNDNIPNPTLSKLIFLRLQVKDATIHQYIDHFVLMRLCDNPHLPKSIKVEYYPDKTFKITLSSDTKYTTPPSSIFAKLEQAQYDELLNYLTVATQVSELRLEGNVLHRTPSLLKSAMQNTSLQAIKFLKMNLSADDLALITEMAIQNTSITGLSLLTNEEQLLPIRHYHTLTNRLLRDKPELLSLNIPYDRLSVGVHQRNAFLQSGGSISALLKNAESRTFLIAACHIFIDIQSLKFRLTHTDFCEQPEFYDQIHKELEEIEKKYKAIKELKSDTEPERAIICKQIENMLRAYQPRCNKDMFIEYHRILKQYHLLIDAVLDHITFLSLSNVNSQQEMGIFDDTSLLTLDNQRHVEPIMLSLWGSLAAFRTKAESNDLMSEQPGFLLIAAYCLCLNVASKKQHPALITIQGNSKSETNAALLKFLQGPISPNGIKTPYSEQNAVFAKNVMEPCDQYRLTRDSYFNHIIAAGLCLYIYKNLNITLNTGIPFERTKFSTYFSLLKKAILSLSNIELKLRWLSSLRRLFSQEEREADRAAPSKVAIKNLLDELSHEIHSEEFANNESPKLLADNTAISTTQLKISRLNALIQRLIQSKLTLSRLNEIQSALTDILQNKTRFFEIHPHQARVQDTILATSLDITQTLNTASHNNEYVISMMLALIETLDKFIPLLTNSTLETIISTEPINSEKFIAYEKALQILQLLTQVMLLLLNNYKTMVDKQDPGHWLIPSRQLPLLQSSEFTTRIMTKRMLYVALLEKTRQLLSEIEKRKATQKTVNQPSGDWFVTLSLDNSQIQKRAENYRQRQIAVKPQKKREINPRASTSSTPSTSDKPKRQFDAEVSIALRLKLFPRALEITEAALIEYQDDLLLQAFWIARSADIHLEAAKNTDIDQAREHTDKAAKLYKQAFFICDENNHDSDFERLGHSIQTALRELGEFVLQSNKKLVDIAYEKFRHFNFLDALADFKHAHAEKLHDKEIIVGMAKCYFQLGQRNEAITLLQQYEHLQHREIQLALAYMYININQFDKAESYLNRVTRKSYDWQRLYCEYLYQAKHLELLEQTLSQLTSRQHLASYVFLLAWYNYRLGHFELAEKYFQQLLRHSKKDNPKFASHYASFLIASRQYTKANTVLDKLIEEHPYHLPGILNKAQLFTKRHRYDLALACLDELIEKHPHYLHAYFSKLYVLKRMNDQAGIVELVNTCLDRFPYHPEVEAIHAKYSMNHAKNSEAPRNEETTVTTPEANLIKPRLIPEPDVIQRFNAILSIPETIRALILQLKGQASCAVFIYGACVRQMIYGDLPNHFSLVVFSDKIKEITASLPKFTSNSHLPHLLQGIHFDTRISLFIQPATTSIEQFAKKLDVTAHSFLVDEAGNIFDPLRAQQEVFMYGISRIIADDLTSQPQLLFQIILDHHLDGMFYAEEDIKKLQLAIPNLNQLEPSHIIALMRKSIASKRFAGICSDWFNFGVLQTLFPPLQQKLHLKNTPRIGSLLCSYAFSCDMEFNSRPSDLLVQFLTRLLTYLIRDESLSFEAMETFLDNIEILKGLTDHERKSLTNALDERRMSFAIQNQIHAKQITLQNGTERLQFASK